MQGLRLRGEEEPYRVQALPSLWHEALASDATSPAAIPRPVAHDRHHADQGGRPASHRAVHPPPLGPGHHLGELRPLRSGGHAQGSVRACGSGLRRGRSARAACC
ncbi:hypothetical protein MYSTI_04353 [Myxococcus stipitatus DSM 14675]|uniref:Uncharacterized protein n=1 Tax=Myxococcus stipitatus (strain DSM 14675 / JCM 12634 / Mx s8) TaxID=1278073 RepID=L7U9N5_MYXSD|nr:hypothetical protein MYSTI_04353 [Myxococcus stipitatus DSM 14675]